MVMATGIVSVALHLLGMEAGALALFYVNIGMFCCLWVVYILRLCLYPRNFFGDMSRHARGPGYLTIVAGTGLLGNQYALLLGQYCLACGLFWLALAVWCFFIWANFLALFTTNRKPPIEKGINGAWLLNTVSCQALVILGCVIIDHTNWDHETAFLLLTALFGTGFMLYAIVITLIVYRLCYTPLPPAELDPSFWVTAGAVAITTLAGSELILRAGGIALSPIRAALSQGHDSHGLGIRGLVGDHAVHSRAVAARTAALPLCLHARLLEHGLPHGHVHGLHYYVQQGAGSGFAHGGAARVHLRGLGKLAVHLLGYGPLFVALASGEKRRITCRILLAAAAAH